MSSILRKLTGAVDFDDNTDAILEEEDLRESLKNKFSFDEDTSESHEEQAQPSYMEETSYDSSEDLEIDEDSAEGVLTIDVYQTDNEIVIVSTIAGVTSKDLDVTITNDMVTIKGERKNRTKIRQEDYFYQECYWGPFSRSVILPIDVDAEKSGAELKDGVLIVSLPKSEKVKSKKIPIK
jgi:HSP20 family protein